MTGKTHAVLGSAAALALTRPQSVSEIAAVTAVSVFSSLMVDLDVKSSKANKLVNKVIIAAIAIAVISAVLDGLLNLGLSKLMISKAAQHSAVMKPTSIVLMIVYFALTGTSGHRGFTHSIAAAVMVTAFCSLLFREIITIAFISGYCAHILIDLLNKKGEQLLFPFKKRFCFNVCKSDGMVSKSLFMLGAIISLLEIIGWSVVLTMTK
jgi:inner membrane protein